MISTLPLEVLLLSGVGAPACLLFLLGVASILNRPLPERWIGRVAASSLMVSSAALGAALVVFLTTRSAPVLLSYRAWSASSEEGIAIEFLLDGMSLGFAALSAAIAGVVSAFSNRYLHREAGYNRYFVQLAMFVTGMLLVAVAGNVEVLFVGWEFIGLSSALLVAFFHDRPAPVSNALRVFTVYRISDAAMLSAAVLLHHVAGSGSLSLLFGSAQLAPATTLSATDATIIAVLLIVAVAAKSALLPFSGWLPRAMEGPTPSSAVYYGSLSCRSTPGVFCCCGPGRSSSNRRPRASWPARWGWPLRCFPRSRRACRATSNPHSPTPR
jgi:NAD(P)H-quinone oxidoreductase subunit 5